MDARYLQAVTVLPKQEKVCGKTLLPFCLRHRVSLEAIQSPFVKKGYEGINPYYVIMAIRIISTYDKTDMAKPLSFFEKLWMMYLTFNNKYYSQVIGTIIGCINVSCSYPKFWEKEKKQKVVNESIPWILSCVANNVRNGCSLEEAWTMPEGEAIWMSISHAIYNGAKIDILSTDEEKELENYNERIEAYKKRMNHNG
jgi:hypothetical protein